MYKVLGAKPKEQRKEEHYEKAIDAGIRIDHVFNNTNLPDSFMKPPPYKLTFISGMKYVYKRLEGLGMTFGNKVPDLRDGNCLFQCK